MTVRLLVDFKDPADGKQYVVGNLYTSAANEAGLIATKQATSDLTGGTAWVDPVVPESIDETKGVNVVLDANGNMALVGAGGTEIVRHTKIGNIIKQRIGRAAATRSNASVARTEQVAFRVRKKILAIRFGIEGYDTVTHPIDMLKFTSVATTADFENAHLGTIQSALFSASAAGTIPARVSANRPGMLISDWIDTSIEAGSYLVARALFTGTNPFLNTYSSYAVTPTEMGALSPEMQLYGWGALVDYVTAFDSWGTTLAAAQSNLGIHYIEYLCEARTVNVCCVGDSLTVGQVDSGTTVVSPVHAACEQMSSANVLYSPMVKGWGGSTSAEHYNIALDVIANTPPDVLIYQAWTQNNVANAGDTEIRYAMDIVNRCKAAGIVPVLITGVPMNAWVTPTNDAIEAARVALNARVRALGSFGVIVIDADAVLSDGASPANYISTYGSGTHPNDAGYNALVTEYKTNLQRVALN